MTQVLYLHVGAPKSGTTFIQRVLDHNAEVLAQAGVLVVGPRLDLIHAAMVIRGDQRLHDLPPAANRAWQRVVAQVREWHGPTAVASYELLANASADQVRTALADLEGVEVHVVVTARDLGKAIGSSWQEQLKFGVARPLHTWAVPQEDAAHSEWGWRTMQPANVAARWGASLPPERVHVVTAPAAADSSVLWQRFAQACALDAVAGLDLAVERANESLGVVEAELLRRVNKALDRRIRGGRQKSLWIRDLLAHRILAPLGREPIGQTAEHAAEAAREAESAAAAITVAGYSVHGDLDDLRPRQVEGRLPSEVSDREVAESAVLALADLLVWAHDDAHDASTPPESGRSSAKGAVRTTLARMAAPYRDRRAERLEQRIAELEAEVEKSRELHLRVATLSDVVTELLLPAAHRDKELTKRALRAYRQRSL